MVFQLAGVGGSRRHGADRARQVARLTRFEMNSAALNVCGGNLVADECKARRWSARSGLAPQPEVEWVYEPGALGAAQ